MRATAVLALLAGLALLLPVASPNGAQAIWPDGAGHDHSNPAHHQGVASGLRQLAQVPITNGQTGSLDARDGLAAIAHFGRAGLTTVDVSDPANPRKLGSLAIGTGGGMDVKILPGNQRAILGTQGGACAFVTPGPGIGTGCGLTLVDISDPAAPKALYGLPFPGLGVHMLDVAVILGVPYVFAVAQVPTYEVFIVAVVGDAALVPVGVLATDNPSAYVHDVTVRSDPLTGATIAYVAAWDQGVWIWDVSVPLLPVELGRWDGDSENIHNVMVTYAEGRRILVAAPEYFNSAHVLDATDFGNIVELSHFRFPDNKPQGTLTFSMHDFNILDGKVYMAHYHGGVLVWGVRTLAEASDPPLLAYALPTGAKQTSGSAPLTWDAFPLGDGTVLAGDMTYGLVTFAEA